MVNLILSGLCSAFLPATITTGLVVNPDGKNDSCCQEKIMYVNRQFRQGSKFYFFLPHLVFMVFKPPAMPEVITFHKCG